MKCDWNIYWTFDTADYQIIFDVTEDDDLDLLRDDSGETREESRKRKVRGLCGALR